MNEIQRKLLNKYLDGTCSLQELETVKAMLEEPGTEDLLHELMQERASRYEGAIPDDALADKVKNWEDRVVKRIETASGKLGSEHANRSVSRFRFLRYAAVWAGILLLGMLVVWQLKKESHQEPSVVAYVEQVNKEALPVMYVLPDSSKVYLGIGSTIRYPQQFTATSREVNLSGEAFFEVTHDRERPFLVQTRSMQTRVLGTSFKIEAHGNYPLVVAVATGKVGVRVAGNGQSKELATLTPGRKLIYNEAAGTHTQVTTDIAALQQWANGDLVFDEQPLQQVMQELEKRYGISVTIVDEETGNYKISGSFERGQDLRSVLTMLGVIGRFQYKFMNDKTVVITK